MLSFPMSNLKKNQSAVVIGISCPVNELPGKKQMVRRLLDLGFCEGTPVTCVNTGIFRNPHAYSIRGTVIAIRNEDASMILVRKTNSV